MMMIDEVVQLRIQECDLLRMIRYAMPHKLGDLRRRLAECRAALIETEERVT